MTPETRWNFCALLGAIVNVVSLFTGVLTPGQMAVVGMAALAASARAGELRSAKPRSPTLEELRAAIVATNCGPAACSAVAERYVGCQCNEAAHTAFAVVREKAL